MAVLEDAVTELVTMTARVMLGLGSVEAKWRCSAARNQEVTMMKGTNGCGVAAEGA